MPSRKAMAVRPVARRPGTRGRDRVRSLVLEHLGVAEAIARRYSGSTRDPRDLEQVAYVGLVKAAHHFDRKKGDEFVSYAVPTISGEVKRYLRDNGWFVRPPRPVQELRARLMLEAPELAQRLGRMPTSRELAGWLDLDIARVREALGAGDGMRPASLDATVSSEDGELLAETIGRADPALERAERLVTIARACRCLTPREQRIVYLRFFEERTQQEIGRELGVTQMQVSRLLARILEQLRERLAETPATAEAIGVAAPTVTVAPTRGHRVVPGVRSRAA